MVFCNDNPIEFPAICIKVTILILIDGFLQLGYQYMYFTIILVTILILIDGFLQLRTGNHGIECDCRHNPYFNRWFSAIDLGERALNLFKGSQSLF